MCRLVRFCKCAKVGLVKLFFKCAVGKFLNPSGRLECRQGQVGLCQGTAKLSAVFGCPFFGCVGRPTLAGNGSGACREFMRFSHERKAVTQPVRMNCGKLFVLRSAASRCTNKVSCVAPEPFSKIVSVKLRSNELTCREAAFC